MPKITALLHCHSQPEQLARALETLRACDEIVIINHDSDNETGRVGRQYGATVKVGVPGVSFGTYLVDASNDWILCLKPSESLSDELEASLLEWKQQEHEAAETFAVSVRVQQDTSWETRGHHTRLVNRTYVNWTTELPPDTENSEVIPGDLLEIESAAAEKKAS
jgi:hypothetical protein